MGGWSISFDYTFTCQDAERRSEKIIIDTFKLTTITVHNDSCAEIHEMVPLFNENITSSPGFFVFTGIVSLLFVLGILVVYLFFWGLYESNNLFAMIVSSSDNN
uniref:Uncharacterized protein n=1 Tax=Plectus sambesii TaxID=2011161 RepID=A0A914VKG0_9BILA